MNRETILVHSGAKLTNHGPSVYTDTGQTLKTMRARDVFLKTNYFLLFVLTCKRILRSFSCNKHLREDMG